MPSTVNTSIQGYSALVTAVRALQTYLSRPVSSSIDNQGIGPEIIKIQTYLSTVAAGGQPSGFKFDPAKINKSIDDQLLGARLIGVQVAADLT